MEDGTASSTVARMRFVSLALSVAVWLLTGAGLAHAQELPTPVGKVNDFAEVLQPADRAALETALADLERATSAEVAVVTIRSLYGQTVEAYATALFNTWGIGKKGKDNGVLVLVAVDDRKMRIEVGYGLEGVLPDGLSGAIIRETFTPKFRANDYRSGILEGTARVAEIVRRNETLTPAQLAALEKAAADARRSWGMAIFLALFVALGAFIAGTGAGARVIVQTGLGAFFALAILGGGSTITPLPAVGLLAALGVAIFLWALRLGRQPGWQQRIRGTSASSGWMVSGAGGGARTGSSGSSSSGSSFGGGRSGGGGASGSW